MTGRRERPGWWARWHEHRRARRQRALEREYLRERLDPSTRAYTDADNHARRWTSFYGGFG
ncbi:MAG: hypothetical protein LC777_07495 [Actinobacteria bacterium]|nr:hypothetical protein [Actinomycetota bacterium]